jgi:hypothetical protein
VDHVEPIPFPGASEPSDEELEAALADAVAGLAAAHAQLAGVGFQLDRPEVTGALAIIVGPLV